MEKVGSATVCQSSRGYGNILDYIGNTPLVPIKRLNANKRVRLLAKLEQTNPGGSIKDRPALSMIEAAEASGTLTKRKTVLEATSGNTGIGLAMVCALKGYRLLLAMSESTSMERKQRLEAFGARLKLTPAQKGSDGAIEFAYELARMERERYFLVDQYNNDDNWRAHYRGTAPEIWDQTGGEVTAVVVTLGTGGTAMGISKGLKKYSPHVRVIGVEPHPGHHIQGLKNMKESYVPGIFDKHRLDACVTVDDEEAFALVRRLALEEGLFVGMSSGAALAGALRVIRNQTEGTVVVVFPDGGGRYMSTGVFGSPPGTRDGTHKPGLRFFNTLSRQLQPFQPKETGKVSMYTCGPTADGNLHLALGRRLIVADLLKRHLVSKGVDVAHIVNITDLDDRIIKGAEKNGQSPKDFARPHIDAIMEDIDRLGVQRASVYPRTSRHIPEMIDLTRALLNKGVAYEKNRSVYFDIARYREYARFSGIALDRVKVGATVDLDAYEKSNPLDFALFKRATLKELKRGIFFDTPWGLCRPGWHIQCAAMSMKYLGENFDIHTSESHLTFPHNENEIAIAGAATGKPLARYWMISAPVMVNGRAMSDKSNNRITLRRLLESGYKGRQLRFFLLRIRYRKPLIYSHKTLEDACKALHRLDTFVKKVWRCRPGAKGEPVESLINELERRFNAAMDDDLNVSAALAELFGFIKTMNPLVDGGKLDASGIDGLRAVLGRINAVLGVFDPADEALDVHAETLIKRRELARQRGDWQAADDLRTGLLNYGFLVFDSPVGAIWERISEQYRQ
jgi:cysteinyl-tRNA synthetase